MFQAYPKHLQLQQLNVYISLKVREGFPKTVFVTYEFRKTFCWLIPHEEKGWFDRKIKLNLSIWSPLISRLKARFLIELAPRSSWSIRSNKAGVSSVLKLNV